MIVEVFLAQCQDQQVRIILHELLPPRGKVIQLGAGNEQAPCDATLECERAGHGTFLEFGWQRNYHDHIIRNEDDLNSICQYIISNPARWVEVAENA